MWQKKCTMTIEYWVVLLRSFITSKVQHVNNRWSCCRLYCKQSNNFLFLFSIWLIEGGEGWSFSITTVQFVYYLMPDIICAHCVRLYLFRKKIVIESCLYFFFPTVILKEIDLAYFLGSQKLSLWSWSVHFQKFWPAWEILTHFWQSKIDFRLMFQISFLLWEKALKNCQLDFFFKKFLMKF